MSFKQHRIYVAYCQHWAMSHGLRIGQNVYPKVTELVWMSEIVQKWWGVLLLANRECHGQLICINPALYSWFPVVKKWIYLALEGHVKKIGVTFLTELKKINSPRNNLSFSSRVRSAMASGIWYGLSKQRPNSSVMRKAFYHRALTSIGSPIRGVQPSYRLSHPSKSIAHRTLSHTAIHPWQSSSLASSQLRPKGGFNAATSNPRSRRVNSPATVPEA